MTRNCHTAWVRRYRSISLLLQVCLILIGLLAFVMPSECLAEDDMGIKVVRVGYYEDNAFQIGATPGAVKAGYSYEYLQRLKRITNWEYRYVYGNFADLYGKLLKGEIDLLTGLAYSASRADLIYYPTLPMGHTPYYLFKRSSDDSLTEDPATLNGKKIGALEGNMKTLMQGYLSAHRVDAELVVFKNTPDRDLALREGKIDVALIEEATSSAEGGLDAYLDIGSSDFFVCIAKTRPDLLIDLEEAQDRLLQQNPKLLSDLTARYFRRTAVSTTLSEREKRWVERHKKIIIGYHNNYLPYSGTDADGRATGLVRDVVSAVFNVLKIHGVEPVYKGYSDFSDLLTALNNHEVDVAFPAHVNFWVAEKYKFNPSAPVINTYLDVVYQGKQPDLTKAVFAIPKTNLLLTSFKDLWYAGNKALYYDTIDECLDAVIAKKADAALVNGLRANLVLGNKFRYRSLTALQIPGDVALGFAATRSSTDTLQILDHGIDLIGPAFSLYHTLPYQPSHQVTFLDIVLDNLMVSILVCALIFAIVVYLLIRVSVKRREVSLLAVMARVDKMTNLGNRRAFDEYMDNLRGSPIPSDFAFVQMDLNGLKRMNDGFGHVAGDEMIVMAAACMRSVLVPFGTVFRIGGDEFAALLNIPDEQLESVMSNLKAEFARAKGEYCPGISVSVGCVYAKDSPELSLEQMEREADVRMYEDKKAYYRSKGLRSGNMEARL